MSYLCNVRKRDNKAPVTLFHKVSTGRVKKISYKVSKTFPIMLIEKIIKVFNPAKSAITYEVHVSEIGETTDYKRIYFKINRSVDKCYCGEWQAICLADALAGEYENTDGDMIITIYPSQIAEMKPEL